ncbi:MFS transporter [Marinobacter salicampi]|uniref:MFS transporter n=1 Tax=Marinobacter salicampi TaxID=435907 RepID=UPI00140BBB4B|nr:nitrate/nitrite transporter [Marinobacter salicampi]
MDTAATRFDQNLALGLATVAFTLCFAVWTLFSIIGIRIQQEFGLSETQLGLLMATPILTGAISRLFLGIWADRVGGRRVFGVLMLATSACVYLLTLADSYPMLLAGALGVGLAGGSFIVGVIYTAPWFEPERQRTALGIFGTGNAGAAVTHFCAPFLLVAFGWETAAQVYAAVLAMTGVVFLVLAREDPLAGSRHRRKPPSFARQLVPLADPRVWRFSLYYFFVFGAFVALALWLPHYLMEVYGLSLAGAGIAAALYTLPASVFRVLGGWLSDRYGARLVMYWSLGASLVGAFVLSYPPTEYVIQGVEGDVSFRLEMGLAGFVVLTFALGFFMSLGQAAVFRHIPAYYPGGVGSVGGVVTMIGGLGGFFLPLGFGLLNDVTGIWQSAFMLLFVIVAVALLSMHFSVRAAEKKEWQADQEKTDLPGLSR